MKPVPLRSLACVTGACLALSSIFAHAADDKKIRGIYVGLSNDLSMLEEAAEKGVNALFTGGASHLVDFNEPVKVRAVDAKGQSLEIRRQTSTAGEHDLFIRLKEPGRQIVRLEFTAPIRDLRFKAKKGLTPWFASSATAPFPK